jgi:hypothetical protein
MVVFQILVFHGVFLSFIALLVRFSGNTEILARSSHCEVKDVRRLNKFAGNRLLILPVLAFSFAQLSIESVGMGILGLMLLWIAIFGVIIWISIGSKRL